MASHVHASQLREVDPQAKRIDQHRSQREGRRGTTCQVRSRGMVDAPRPEETPLDEGEGLEDLEEGTALLAAVAAGDEVA